MAENAFFAGSSIARGQISCRLDVVDEVIPFPDFAVLTAALQKSLGLSVEESNEVNVRIHKRKVLRRRPIELEDLECRGYKRQVQLVNVRLWL
jgi:hypothetical protein